MLLRMSRDRWRQVSVWRHTEDAVKSWPLKCLSLSNASSPRFLTRSRQSSCEQKPIKNLGEKGALAYRWTAQIFPVPPIISGTCKAANFKSGRYIHRVHANKSPLKIWEKRVRGRIEERPKFLQYPLLSQECVKLRTSNLAGIFIHRVHPSKSPLNLEVKGAWAYPGTAKMWEQSHWVGLVETVDYMIIRSVCIDRTVCYDLKWIVRCDHTLL